MFSCFCRRAPVRLTPSAASVTRASFSSSSGDKRSLDSLQASDVAGKNVLVRVDFNVPVDKTTGAITDDTRIRDALPSIKYLMDKGARVILASHMGRPKKQVVESLRLSGVNERLSELLGTPTRKVDDCVGPSVETAVSQLQNGQVLLLENLRFHAGEEANDPAFVQSLVDSTQAQVYVNDAFGCAHRAHASTEGVAHKVTGPSVAGFLLQKELKFLINAVNKPVRPFAAIVGGAKISTKIGVLDSLLERCDTIVLGGAMIFTFYKAQGLQVGNSLVEDDKIPLALELAAKAKSKGVALLLPTDVLVASELNAEAQGEAVSVEAIPEGKMGLDIGPKSISLFQEALKPCKTIVWNGPMGCFEYKAFERGTYAIAETLGEVTTQGATTIIGGGDSVAAINKAGLAHSVSHISTGGGASLELLEGKVLPGVAALDDL